MARLSQKAWNNVIIFSMLIMITVLNLDRFSGTDEASSRQLIAQGELILSLQIDQNVIERVGQSWRISPNSPAASESIDAERLARVVNNWSSAIVEPAVEQIDLSLFSQPRHIAVVWLAGEPQAKVFPIIIQNDVPLIEVESQAYVIDFPNLSQLVSW